MARCSARLPACRTWNRAKRTACWTSSSPPTSTSARAQKSSRQACWSAKRPCQPSCAAAASAASTWSAIAGSERVPDQPWATSFSTRSVCPGSSTEVTVSRATSAPLSLRVVVRSGPLTTWSAATATLRPLRRVRCTSRSRLPEAKWSSGSSGDCSAMAARGSPFDSGRLSPATSSDWITTRLRPSTASTS